MDFDDECADEELQVVGNDHDDPPQQEDASRRKRRRFTSNSGSGRDAVKTCLWHHAAKRAPRERSGVQPTTDSMIR